jgi:protein HIRA/HIR1
MAKPVHTQNICSVVALGSDDLSISVWQTKSARPLIVAKDVFERPVMDLTWWAMSNHILEGTSHIGWFP